MPGFAAAIEATKLEVPRPGSKASCTALRQWPCYPQWCSCDPFFALSHVTPYHARMARRAQHLRCSLCERSELVGLQPTAIASRARAAPAPRAKRNEIQKIVDVHRPSTLRVAGAPEGCRFAAAGFNNVRQFLPARAQRNAYLAAKSYFACYWVDKALFIVFKRLCRGLRFALPDVAWPAARGVAL